MSKFVYFHGDETEKEFLQKCLKQWEILIENDAMFKSRRAVLGNSKSSCEVGGCRMGTKIIVGKGVQEKQQMQ